ncbi:hypothetical protein ACOME3_004216 [Neoechinorhynchus agilis]
MHCSSSLTEKQLAIGRVNTIFADNGYKRNGIMRFSSGVIQKRRNGKMIHHGIDMKENRFSRFHISVKRSLVMLESSCDYREWMPVLSTIDPTLGRVLRHRSLICTQQGNLWSSMADNICTLSNVAYEMSVSAYNARESSEYQLDKAPQVLNKRYYSCYISESSCSNVWSMVDKMNVSGPLVCGRFAIPSQSFPLSTTESGYTSHGLSNSTGHPFGEVSYGAMIRLLPSVIDFLLADSKYDVITDLIMSKLATENRSEGRKREIISEKVLNITDPATSGVSIARFGVV